MKKNRQLKLLAFSAGVALTFSQAAVAQVVTQTLNFTGSLQTVTLSNLCASQVTITCYGAAGAVGGVGTSTSFGTGTTSPGGAAGLGGMATAVYTAAANTTLNVYVGGVATGSNGGFNG